MIRDLKDFFGEFFEKIKSSRLFILGVIYIIMIFVLGSKLFTMQMVNGKEAQEEYVQQVPEAIYMIETAIFWRTINCHIQLP